MQPGRALELNQRIPFPPYRRIFTGTDSEGSPLVRTSVMPRLFAQERAAAMEAALVGQAGLEPAASRSKSGRAAICAIAPSFYDVLSPRVKISNTPASIFSFPTSR